VGGMFGWSKRRRVASKFGVRSWWPGRSEPIPGPSSTTSLFCRLSSGSFCILHSLSVISAYIAPMCTLHIMCCTHLHLHTIYSAPTCTFAHHALHPPAPPHTTHCTHRTFKLHALHPSAPPHTSCHTLHSQHCAADTWAFMRPNSFQHGRSRFTRASFGLLPPRVPQLTSQLDPQASPDSASHSATRCSHALSMTASAHSCHNSSCSISQVRSTALSYIMRAHAYCPSRRVLDSLPGAKNLSSTRNRIRAACTSKRH